MFAGSKITLVVGLLLWFLHSESMQILLIYLHLDVNQSFLVVPLFQTTASVAEEDISSVAV